MNTIREEIKKIAKLINGRTIYFDHKSYDFAEDIPHLILEGKRNNINSVSIGLDGLTMNVVCGDIEYGLVFYEEGKWTFADIDKELEDIGMDRFLRDIYYETNESWEIGDYEDDFLPNVEL